MTTIAAGFLLAVTTQAQNPSHRNLPTDTSVDGRWMTVQGTIVDETTNAPLPGIQVTLMPAVGGVTVHTLYTDSEGRFQAMLAPGTYRVSAQGGGYESAEATVSPTSAAPPLLLSIRRLGGEPNAQPSAFVAASDLKAPSKAVKAFNKGMENLEKHQPDKAETEFQQAIAIYPDYSSAYYRLGLAQVELGEAEPAANSFQKAIDLTNGRQPGAQFAMGALLCEEKRFAEAERVIERGEAIDAGAWQGPLFMGQALFGLGKLDEAESQEREALRRRPEVPLAYLILANIHISKQLYRELVNDLDQYLKLQPTGPTSDTARQTRELALRRIGGAPSEKSLLAKAP